MKIAVEGCAHGELEKIYDSIANIERRDNLKVDLLICCGDFQSTRNVEDLQCMAVPVKYQDMCSFYKYYSGEKEAPILTLFIGGNHEASNYLQELAFGGWVAPNIYYLGYAGVVNVGGVRIAGLSGIYKGHDFMKGHFELPPYGADTKRSVYHVRNVEVFRLKQLKQPIDIFLSHDWPRGIYEHGNTQQLLKKKPFFKDEVNCGSLGSQPCQELLHHLKPAYWFAAHLHVKFAALVTHEDEEEGTESKETKFLALDKCLPRRQFLQILEIPHDSSKPLELEYDLEWLSVLHFSNHLTSVKRNMQYLPQKGDAIYRWDFSPTSEELDFIRRKMGNALKVPLNFTQTASSFDPATQDRKRGGRQPNACINPQTMTFCDTLGINDPMAMMLGQMDTSLNSSNLNQTLPSFLTPEKPGDVTQVSSEESPPREAQWPSKRVSLSLTLPSPKNQAPSEVESVDGDDSQAAMETLPVPSPPQLVSHRDVPSEPVAEESDARDRLTATPPGGPDSELERGDVVPHPAEVEGGGGEKAETPSLQVVAAEPVVKKFKRRNQAMYENLDDV